MNREPSTCSANVTFESATDCPVGETEYIAAVYSVAADSTPCTPCRGFVMCTGLDDYDRACRVVRDDFHAGQMREQQRKFDNTQQEYVHYQAVLAARPSSPW